MMRNIAIESSEDNSEFSVEVMALHAKCAMTRVAKAEAEVEKEVEEAEPVLV